MKTIILISMMVVLTGCLGSGLDIPMDTTLNTSVSLVDMGPQMFWHLDASDEASIIIDTGLGVNAVVQWNDKVNNYPCISAYTTTPLLRSNALNGKPVIDFADASTPNQPRPMNCNNFVATPFQHSHTLVYVASAPTENHMWQAIFGGLDSLLFGFTGGPATYQIRAIQGNVANSNSLMTSNVANPVAASSGFTIVTYRFDVNQLVYPNTSSAATTRRNTMRVNGVQQAVVTNLSAGEGTYDATTVAVMIGGQKYDGGGSITNYFTGKLAEFQIYDSALSDEEAKSIECSLSTKWGIAVSGC